MKDLGQMHYFMGLEVWQQKGEIFLGQGRYATEILKRFRIQDCRPMATPMITNWKKIDASEDKDVDPTLYRRKMEATRIMCDNQSCIKLSENPVFHDRSNHIDIWCHFVRDCVQRGAVQLSYTPTREQVADILTKALGRTKFDYSREEMGMIKNPFEYQK
eukprot:PITA_34518